MALTPRSQPAPHKNPGRNGSPGCINASSQSQIKFFPPLIGVTHIIPVRNLSLLVAPAKDDVSLAPARAARVSRCKVAEEKRRAAGLRKRSIASRVRIRDTCRNADTHVHTAGNAHFTFAATTDAAAARAGAVAT